MELALLDESRPELLPNPERADASGLVAASRKLGAKRLLAAYQRGIFPWMKMPCPPHLWCWYSPDPRMLLYPREFKVSRSLARTLKSHEFEIRIDHDFVQVMRQCATIKRPHQEKSWIESDMLADYEVLHRQGIAHSIEAYQSGNLVGGLYGLALGKAFFGESMFHRTSEASKACMAKLVELSLESQLRFIDCQVSNPFLQSLGAREIPRALFLRELEAACEHSSSTIDWKLLKRKNPDFTLIPSSHDEKMSL